MTCIESKEVIYVAFESTGMMLVIYPVVKANAYNTYITPQAAHRSCSGAFVSQSGRTAYRP